MVKTTALLLLAVIPLGGCSLITDSFLTNDFSGDPFPTNVDTRSGAVLLGLRSQGQNHIAVLDILSPLTLIDPGPNVEATIDTEDLILLGDRPGLVGMPDLPRASFSEQQVLRLHPCAVEEPTCLLGQAGATELPFDAIVGADALAGDALRLRLGTDQIMVLADVGGTDRDRTFACDAVFINPYRGGGTLIVADTEVPFAGRRVTVQACLGADPNPLIITQDPRGTDALFVMSTSIGPSLLSESGYERYRQHRSFTPPPLSTLPEVQLSLPSGPITGRATVIDNIALVSRASSEPLAPCRQFFAHHLLIDRDCRRGVDDCPCEDNESFCPVPASVGINPPGGIEFLIVSDANATLQALRTEFRPNLQEIDGILGTDAMRDIELDIDYPHNRFLARCTSPSPTCVTRPAMEFEEDRNRVRACLGLTPVQ